MMKLTVSVVAVALSAAATVAIAQTTSAPVARIMAPSATDAAVREQVMSSAKPAPHENLQSETTTTPGAAKSPSLAAAATNAVAKGAEPGK